MPVKGGGRKRPAAQQPKQMKSQQQQTKRQKKPEPDFHYVKLQNAFLAHQEVHNDLQKDTLDGALKKLCFKKRALYEQEIIKLLRQKEMTTASSQSQQKQVTNNDKDNKGSSSVFFSLQSPSAITKNGSQKTALVPREKKNGTETQFFIRRKPPSTSTSTLEKEINAIPNFNSSGSCQFIDELIDLMQARITKNAAALDLELLKRTLEREQQQGGSKQDGVQDTNNTNSTASSSSASSPAPPPALGDSSIDLEIDCTTQSEEAETPISSACPSPVKKNPPSTSLEYDAEKAEFFRKLGLVSREEYDEVANRKNYRKRRTTANPQFSSAALEAKRQTKMEIIAERKNRRLQEKALKAQGSLLSIADAAATGSDVQGQVATTIIKAGGKKPLFSDNKSKSNFKIENKQVFPGLYLVKRIVSGKYYCKLCEELCQCAQDTVIVCKRCSVFFHLNCATPKRRSLTKVNYELSCPGCSTTESPDSKTQVKVESEQKSELKTEDECLKDLSGEGADSLLSHIHELRKYILSLTRANKVLELLCDKREVEKRQLQFEVNELENIWSTMKQALGQSLFFESEKNGDVNVQATLIYEKNYNENQASEGSNSSLNDSSCGDVPESNNSNDQMVDTATSLMNSANCDNTLVCA